MDQCFIFYLRVHKHLHFTQFFVKCDHIIAQCCVDCIYFFNNFYVIFGGVEIFYLINYDYKIWWFLQMSSFVLCKGEPCKFGVTLGWINDDRISIFGLTMSLTHRLAL